MQLCQDLAREGKTVVAVMHDIQLAAAYCDEIALMNDGRIVACGAPESVLTDERLTDVYRWPISTAALATGEFVIVPQRSAGASSDPGQQKHGKVAR